MRRRIAILAFALIVAALACNTPAAQPGDDTPTGGDTPSVTISSPAPNAQATVGQTLQVQSLATDSVGVTRVDMAVDGVVVRSDTAPDPAGQTTLALLQNWSPTQPGQHTITLTAYRADGTASAPASVIVNVAAAGSGPTATPTTGPCTAQTTTDLNVRNGPSTAYAIQGVLAVGKVTPVVGRNNDSSWWQISFAAGSGWVSTTYVTLSGSCGSVPVGSFPPPPPPQPTKTPTPTLTLTPAITNTPGPADLVVTNIEMPTALVLINSKAKATIKVTIKNTGAQIATSFKVYIYPTGVSGSGGLIDLGTVASLHADETLTLTGEYIYTTAGTYTVAANVDPENKVSEGDEGNNIRTLAVQVSLPTPTPTATATDEP